MINKLKKVIDKLSLKEVETRAIFDKATIKEITLIRQRLKEEFGNAPDLQDPKLLEELINCAYLSKNAISRSDIRKLMESIGEPWISHYKQSNQRRIDESDALM